MRLRHARWVHHAAAVARWAMVPLLLVGQIAGAEVLVGVVVGVADGDTITLLDSQHAQHRVRLAGIDAPEKGQDFGDVSRRSLRDLAHGHHAVVETHKMDRYGRAVGKVMVEGEDVGIEQVRRGLAWHYKTYQREQSRQDRAAYTEAENTAKALRKGLWATGSAVPPWEYRRGIRSTGSGPHGAVAGNRPSED